MAVHFCKVCGKSFTRETLDPSRAKYCSQSCYRYARRKEGNEGFYRKGNVPWNKGIKGLHFSPETEFKKGGSSNRIMPIGSVVVRKRLNRNEAERAWVKIGMPNTWQLRAVVVWEKANGRLAKGQLLHHKDGNSLNDCISNLCIMTRSEHAIIHGLPEHGRRARAAKAK